MNKHDRTNFKEWLKKKKFAYVIGEYDKHMKIALAVTLIVVLISAYRIINGI